MSTEIQDKVSAFFAGYPLFTYDKQQIIIRGEETPNHVFYIIEGRVSQYDIAASGNEVVVNVFKPGAFFPMSSALNHTQNLYFFEASTKVTIRQAPADDVVAFLKANPDVTLDLLSRVYRGVDGVLRRMAHLMGGGAESRLVFELLNAAQRFGQLQPDGSVTIPFKEGDLGKHSGLARETVNRCLQNLKTKGHVEVIGGNITIKSVSQLEAMLGTNL